jgi:hypothetical protein
MSNSTAMLPGYGFQDVILELMLVNENLEKVGKTFQDIRDVLTPLTASSVVPAAGAIVPTGTNTVTTSEKLVERIESVDNRSKEQVDELKKVRGEVYQTNLFMRELLDFFTSKKLQELEDRKEFIDLLKGMRSKEKIEKPLKLSFPAKLLTALLPAIAGAVLGAIEGVKDALSTVGVIKKALPTPAKAPGRATPGKAGGRRLPPRGPGGRFKKGGILDDVMKFFTNIGDSIAAWWKGLVKQYPMLGKIGRWLDDTLKPFVKFMKGVFNFARGVGRFFGKLLLPLTVIMAVVDGVTGFLEGFENTEGTQTDKIIGGLRQGFTEILKGLVAIPLDFLKSAVSWVAGKLGFKEVEAALDSFSFANIVDELGRLGLFDFFMFPVRAVRGFMEAFNTDTEASIVDRLIAGFKQGTMEIFDSILGGFMRIIQKGVVWLAEKFGADQYAEELAKMDPVDEIKKIFYGFVDDIVGFFKGIGNTVTGLFSGEISFIDYLKEGLSAIVTAFLLPIDRFGANITEKILDYLNLPKLRAGKAVELKRSFKPEEKKPTEKKPAVKSIDAPAVIPMGPELGDFGFSTQITPVATNLSGSTMTEYIKDTKDIQEKSKLSAMLPIMASSKGGGQTVINTSNSQTSINQSTAVERTSILLNPMFSYM